MPRVNIFARLKSYATGAAATLLTKQPPTAAVLNEGPYPGQLYPVSYVNNEMHEYSRVLRIAQEAMLAGVLDLSTERSDAISAYSGLTCVDVLADSTYLVTGVSQHEVWRSTPIGGTAAPGAPVQLLAIASSFTIGPRAVSWYGRLLYQPGGSSTIYSYTSPVSAHLTTQTQACNAFAALAQRPSDGVEVWYRLTSTNVLQRSIASGGAALATWTTITPPATCTQVQTFVHSGVEYLVAARSNSTDTVVYVSTDRGATWVTYVAFLNASPTTFKLVVDAVGGRIYLGVTAALYALDVNDLASGFAIATNQFNSHLQIACGGGAVFLVTLPVASAPGAAATSLCHSIDGGVSWGRVPIAGAGELASGVAVRVGFAEGRLTISTNEPKVLRSRAALVDTFARTP